MPIPDKQTILTEFSSRGKRYRVEIQVWHNLLMRGKQKPSHLLMHRHPFMLVRIVRYVVKRLLKAVPPYPPG